MAKGKLQRWHDDKGFGFIKGDDGQNNIFVHISELKNMSRRPIVGDIINYRVVMDADGKHKAVDASIDGVLPVQKRRTKNINRIDGALTTIISAVLFGGIAFYAYHNFKMNQTESVEVSSEIVTEKISPDISQDSTVIAPEVSFHCDGRQYCSQMTSKAEAEYFIKYCPNTKMDGDHDGIACEGDSRF